MALHPSSLPAVLSPVLTPVQSDGEILLELFAKQCGWLQKSNVGLAVFGTNSEGNSFSASQKINALEYLVNHGLAANQMMPGTGACAVADAVTMTRATLELGCSGALMLPPFYYKDPAEDGLFAYYAQIIEKIGSDQLKIYVYNIPPVVKFGIPVTLLERLVAAYPNTVVGMKDSSGDWEYTKACLDALSPKGFRVYAGSESFLLRTLRAGGAGCISATANVNPAAIAHLATHWQDDNADELQAGLDVVRTTFAKYPMIPAMKAACARYSGNNQWSQLCPPLLTLPQETQEKLFTDLDTIQFAMPGL
ncbi:dihydrodipicolinate synthase family protein [Polynucleobacter kasalickyi]|uniref:4-hydroxy-tetrahydrodipicolinate synthase n=1 Tax=Polynucleobacter kasalickyi TaxID=1938817 RepID=A0A1W1Y488_9BURK|nr:dihydrodipicolinate synthase family protein [Polynucleobacter kasalickyi]SMC30976.1 4-hydroxy-tetrahydrodipicolinate synthase [Polynucleobacter kasalickyi]